MFMLKKLPGAENTSALFYGPVLFIRKFRERRG